MLVKLTTIGEPSSHQCSGTQCDPKQLCLDIACLFVMGLKFGIVKNRVSCPLSKFSIFIPQNIVSISNCICSTPKKWENGQKLHPCNCLKCYITKVTSISALQGTTFNSFSFLNLFVCLFSAYLVSFHISFYRYIFLSFSIKRFGFPLSLLLIFAFEANTSHYPK